MKFAQYLKNVQGEITHIKWPTQRQTVLYTVVVILLSLVVASYIGGFDWLFSQALNTYIIG